MNSPLSASPFNGTVIPDLLAPLALFAPMARVKVAARAGPNAPASLTIADQASERVHLQSPRDAGSRRPRTSSVAFGDDSKGRRGGEAGILGQGGVCIHPLGHRLEYDSIKLAAASTARSLISVMLAQISSACHFSSLDLFLITALHRSRLVVDRVTTRVGKPARTDRALASRTDRPVYHRHIDRDRRRAVGHGLVICVNQKLGPFACVFHRRLGKADLVDRDLGKLLKVI